MKKYVALLLALIMCMACAACVKEKDKQDPIKDKPAEDVAAFARTEGTWRLDGASDTAFIVMDGKGGYKAYFATGALESEGSLKYTDELSDGNGRYDMYPAGETVPFAGFYFHSETEFHIGNADGAVYKLDNGQAKAPVLMWPSRFTGMSVLETNNGYKGGYLYKDMTEDGLTVITNCCIETDSTKTEPLEDYIESVVKELSETEPRGLEIKESPELSAKLTYPVKLLSWETGENEDSSKSEALFVMTDTHTYIFIIATALDNYGAMADVWQSVFESLILE